MQQYMEHMIILICFSYLKAPETHYNIFLYFTY